MVFIDYDTIICGVPVKLVKIFNQRTIEEKIIGFIIPEGVLKEDRHFNTYEELLEFIKLNKMGVYRV